ncbi:ABC transporter permease [Anaeromyxobacter sp. Red801]|uniref:ABC transporter permease n=1 Tax=Anaeromyxobacter sp. Red801 TaxID=3411632 RepID=UPI003BA0891B
MTRTLSIAANTLREALRERLLYNLVFFAIAMTIASLTVSRLTLGEQFRIIADVSTSSTQVFGLLISVFVGVSLVAREIDRRTCYALLARPVSRAEFVVGKFLGLLATAGLNLLVMAAVSALALLVYRGDASFLGSGFLAAFGLMIAQFAVAVALAVLFATFTTPTLATIFTLSALASGFLFAEVRSFWLKAEQVELKQVVHLLDVLLPNMGLLDAKEALTYGDVVGIGSVLIRLAYGFGYAGVLLALAALVFSRRDIR